ncbi:MAG TPA: MlaD family protein [Kiritimatiellia bacterium]|nr:MlaD family protein [Kiritimatiellia bacterium]HRU70659.1 MlaD family protein [Kiritimatiellia bacterium]
MNENKANFAKIGFFVLAGAALIVLVIGIAGARTFNKTVVEAETYFAESVTGLDLGSPVKYRGVPVGEVKRIGFVFSEYGRHNDDLLTETSSRQVLVVMALDPERFGLLGSQAADQVLHALVQQGLRVKIASSGVTGLAFLELDYFAQPGSAAQAFPLAWQPARTFIPATTSTMTNLKKAVDDVFVKLSAVDLRALGDELLATLHLLQKTLNKADVAALSAEATRLLSELRETNRSIKQLADSPELAALPADLAATVNSARGAVMGIETNILPLAASLRQVADRADGVLDRAGGLVDSAGGLLATNGAVIGQMVGSLNQTAQTLNRTALTQQGALGELVQSLRTAAEGLERLVGELSANPGALLFGQPPQPLPETK